MLKVFLSDLLMVSNKTHVSESPLYDVTVNLNLNMLIVSGVEYSFAIGKERHLENKIKKEKNMWL